MEGQVLCFIRVVKVNREQSSIIPASDTVAFHSYKVQRDLLVF